jgi:hypothetical protein
MSRTAPPVHVLVDRFAVWNTAVLILGVMASLTWLAWAVSLGTWQGLAWFLLAVVVGASLWWSLRPSAVSLRWDGERWWLGQPSTAGTEPWPVQTMVCMDLGAWVLLQLRAHPDGPELPRRFRWLPLQRQGLQAQWHALRCALFAHAQRARGVL